MLSVREASSTLFVEGRESEARRKLERLAAEYAAWGQERWVRFYVERERA